ncbi:hypothetical protein DMB95_08690 [Campylobacter sp. MIT 12-8780]|uniref:hypothetical protein n=1 Tax=unclassified Campylobacter TaxID=2593542 RepID=UPI00115CA362|nr:MULTISPECIES: hypothetical protein [unclassified Campylobacter]NDJ27971.1 hypothetical protein [Campylobacter sp. MIT 19-121]TQR40097.1 hypothetical protein DMB95_08690 [Campylobacter sp. MIT 12-8780]
MLVQNNTPNLNPTSSNNSLQTSAKKSPSDTLNFKDTLQLAKENLQVNDTNTQSSYSITTEKKYKPFKAWVTVNQNGTHQIDNKTSTKFTDFLNNTSSQTPVSKAQYLKATEELSSLMDELRELALSEHGKDSELGYYLFHMSYGFKADVSCVENLPQTIQQNMQKLHSNLNSQREYEDDMFQLISNIEHYFSFSSMLTQYAVDFFDFVDDKFSGLDDERIKENLAIMKAYWDDKSASQANVVLDDETRVEFKIEETQDESHYSVRILGAESSLFFQSLCLRYENGVRSLYACNFLELEQDLSQNFNLHSYENEKFESLFKLFENHENFKSFNVSNSNSNTNRPKPNLNNTLDQTYSLNNKTYEKDLNSSLLQKALQELV